MHTLKTVRGIARAGHETPGAGTRAIFALLTANAKLSGALKRLEDGRRYIPTFVYSGSLSSYPGTLLQRGNLYPTRQRPITNAKPQKG